MTCQSIHIVIEHQSLLHHNPALRVSIVIVCIALLFALAGLLWELRKL